MPSAGTSAGSALYADDSGECGGDFRGESEKKVKAESVKQFNKIRKMANKHASMIYALALIGFELLYLRLLWGVRMSWGLYLNTNLLVIGFVILNYYLALFSQKPPVKRFNQKYLLGNLFALHGVALAHLFSAPQVALRALWCVSALLALASFVSLTEIREKIRRRAPITISAIICVVLAYSLYKWEHRLWFYMAKPTTFISCNFLQPFVGSDLQCVGNSIKTAKFGIAIHAPCSGVQGFLLMLFVFLNLFIFDASRFTRRQWGGILASGIATMFLVNVFRVSAYFWFGVQNAIAHSSRMEGLLGFFHSSLNSVTYLIVLFGFFLVVQLMVPQRVAKKIK